MDQTTQTFQTLQYKFKTGTSIVNHKQFLSKLAQSPGCNIFDYGFQNSDVCAEYFKRFCKYNIVFSDMSDFFDPQMLNKGFEQEVQNLFNPFHQEQEKIRSIVGPVLKELKNNTINI